MAYCVIFVGNGDAGREVMAKAVLDDRIKKVESQGIEVKARGLVVLFQEPVNSKVVRIIEANHVPLEYDCLFQLEQSDIDSSDVILTMDESQKQKVLDSYKNVEHIYTLKERAGEEGVLLDPYGKELMDYEYCFREISRLVDKIAKKKWGIEIDEE